MAGYVRETVESVLAQDYPGIEYIIMDGGSSDGTLEILDSYKNRLQYYSVADDGAADAINQGFARASGSVLAWLNADDTYLPGAVSTAVRHLNADHEAVGVCGQGYWVDESGNVLGAYPTARPEFDRLQLDCCICQPACFFRREAFVQAGGLDSALNSAFDYDLWIRLSRRGRLESVPQFLANSRMHVSNKTLLHRRQVFQESLAVLQRHYGYVPFNWVYSYMVWRHDGRDQFYEPLCPSIVAYTNSLFAGCWHNRRHPLRYVREWSRAMNVAGFVRRWKQGRFGRMLR